MAVLNNVSPSRQCYADRKHKLPRTCCGLAVLNNTSPSRRCYADRKHKLPRTCCGLAVLLAVSPAGLCSLSAESYSFSAGLIANPVGFFSKSAQLTDFGQLTTQQNDRMAS
ncbi:MAG TPA: hypothetical protein VFK37_00245 [Bacillales bacterium]|nr:hypothetical protein [Bacillales bacterium]